MTWITAVCGLGFSILAQTWTGLLLGVTAGLFFWLGTFQESARGEMYRTNLPHTPVGQLLDELLKLEDGDRLFARVDAKLEPLLERASIACDELEHDMNDAEWKAKADKEPWKSIRNGCLRTAKEGWENVVWAGRTLIRRRRAPKKIPGDVVDETLGAVEEMVVALEQLLANVRGEEETNLSVIDRTRARLAELRAAENELGEEPEFLRE